MNAVISRDGCFEIPRELREELELEPGHILEIKNREGTLVAWKKTEPHAFEKWRGKGTLPIGRNTEDYLRVTRG